MLTDHSKKNFPGAHGTLLLEGLLYICLLDPFSKYVKLPEGRFHTEFAFLDVGIYYPLVIRRGNKKAVAMENHRAKKFVIFGLSSNIIYKWGTLW